MKRMDTSGKVALVTGAAKRIGRAIALELARTGFDVAVHYRSSIKEAREVAEAIGKMGRHVVLVSGDLTDLKTPERIVSQTIDGLGRVDVLVNNASVFDKTPIEQADAETCERMLLVNTIGPSLLARAVAPIMRKAGAGRIINLVDILADRPAKRYGPYCASKAALATLTRSLAIELAPEITVNAVAPGIALFPDDYDEELRNRLISRVPMRRAGTPEEIAALVRFLITDGDYITGQIIAIDGGRSIVP